MRLLTVSNLCAGYGKNLILNDISFFVNEGEIFGILGANGSGKTTLLKALCNLLPHSGKVVINDKNTDNLSVKERAQYIGYIPQRSGIEINMSVSEVVLMGFNPYLSLLESPGKEMVEKSLSALEKVGLKGFENCDYLALSEGQKQLCVLARTIAPKAKILLLDEPESALDFKFRYRIMKLLSALAKENSYAVVVNLHDPMLALNYCDRLLLLSEGKVESIICPKEDSVEHMEEKLKKLYGNISLKTEKDKNGKNHFVLLWEDEA